MMIAVASCLQRETASSLHETSHTETLLLTSAEPSAGSGPSGDCHILKVECQGSLSHKASEFPSSARKSELECLPGRTIASWWRLAQSFVVSHHRLFHRLKFHKGTNDLHNNRHGSWGSHMSQRICLSRCPWDSCCYIPAMDAIAPRCGCSRHGSMLYPTSSPQGFGRPFCAVEHGPCLLQFVQELLVFTSHRCKANGNRQHRELCFRVWNHLQIAVIFVTKGEFVVSMLWGPLETACADILQLLVFQHLVVDHSHWSILTGHGYIVGNMATIGIYRAGSTSLDFNALCPNFIALKMYVIVAPKYESTGILNATGKIFCLNVHRSIHQIIHRSIRSIHIHQVFSWNRYAHADWMPLAARAAKTIRTPGRMPWAAILCEPGSNYNTKCQKTTVMEDPQVFCYELIWAWTTKKSGEKNLPSYDRKTRASRAKKLGIWPKRAPTMWAPRTLLWWPPLWSWALKLDPSYEPRCRSLHAAGHGHSHGHRNLSSQTHCTTPAARAQHTFSNWVFVALLPLHTSCQIHP